MNTVFDWDYEETKPKEERNGFVFYQSDNVALESAMGQALDLYWLSPEVFRSLAIQEMRCEYSWGASGKLYESVYVLLDIDKLTS